MEKQIIKFNNSNSKRRDILKQAEIFITSIAKSMNDRRCGSLGIGRYSQEQPLPGIGEDIRALYNRFKDYFIRN